MVVYYNNHTPNRSITTQHHQQQGGGTAFRQHHAVDDPSLCQLVATAMTWHRILRLIHFVPLMVLALPGISFLASTFLDRLTHHHSLLSLLLTMMVTRTIHCRIEASAPTQAKAHHAIRVVQTCYTLPLLVFGGILAILHGVILPLETRIYVLESILTWSPFDGTAPLADSYRLGFRVALGFWWLGLLVSLRYVGKFSIVRCSTCLLVSPPMILQLQYLWSHVSLSSFLIVTVTNLRPQPMMETMKHALWMWLFSNQQHRYNDHTGHRSMEATLTPSPGRSRSNSTPVMVRTPHRLDYQQQPVQHQYSREQQAERQSQLRGPNSTTPVPRRQLQYQQQYSPVAYARSVSPIMVEPHHLDPRLWRLPTESCILAQLVMSISFGILVALTTVLPLVSEYYHHYNKAYFVTPCVTACVVHLCQSTLYRMAHELDPTQHCASSFSSSTLWPSSSSTCLWNQPQVHSFAASLVNSSAIVTVTSLVACHFLVSSSATMDMATSDDYAERRLPLLLRLLICFLTGSAVTVYLHLFDKALKTLLCSSFTSLRHDVAKATGSDQMNSFLEITMTSLLYGDPNMVQALLCSSPQDQQHRHPEWSSDNDQTELHLSNTATDEIAEQLLYNTHPTMGFHFEEDILRHMIVESVGGTATAGQPFTIKEWDNASFTHRDNLGRWFGLRPIAARAESTGRYDCLAVPLVRALCATFGGLGKALMVIADQQQRRQQQQRAPGNTNTSGGSSIAYFVPPGAVSSGECSMRGAARFLILGLTALPPHLEWQRVLMFKLVPVFLHSTFRLAKGIAQFSGHHHGSMLSVETDELVAANRPELFPLFQACNHSIKLVMDNLEESEGNRRVDVRVERDCQNWVADVRKSLSSDRD